MWRRRRSIVNFKQQLWFGLELVVVAIGFVVIAAFLLFIPPMSGLLGDPAVAERLLEDLMRAVYLQWPFIFLAMVVLTLIGLIMSHRLWGPLYALEKVLEKWQAGDRSARVRFRKYDYLLPTKDLINAFLDQQDALVRRTEEAARRIKKEAAAGNLEGVASEARKLLDGLPEPAKGEHSL